MEIEKRHLVMVILGMVVVLQGCDVATTAYALDRGGQEANPLMVPVVESVHTMLGAKLVGVVLMAGVAVMAERSMPGGAVYPLLAAWGMSLLPVVNNVGQIVGVL
ncbi:hypothetical protein J2129_002750 [Methanofollis sp. W23]|uniref:DUF5658 family protein n=1 Tax=Methanofollis sp. W23 TaxID=2817849 RepID=UPI001AEA16B0|nr:DUF5658 family protein [Methanofollis sp. W23]MBP2147237.1 hypothetical protein [Methanofollis sp. W23]